MSDFKWKALNANVILKEIENVNKLKSGFEITNDADKNSKYRKGIIMSFGELCPKNKDDEYYIKLGDEVMFDNYKSSEVTLEGVTYKTMYYADLLLV